MNNEKRENERRERKISVKIVGGLGNQLFQIAAAYQYAKDNDCNLYCVNACSFPRKPYFRGHLKYLLALFPSIFNEKKEMVFSPFPSYTQPFSIVGYFQSPKYFDIQTLTFIQNLVKDSCSKKINCTTDNLCTVSLHIRRTDYVHLTSHMGCKDIDYYHHAYEVCMENLKKKGVDVSSVVVMVFSDDVAWCKQNLKISNVVYFKDHHSLTDIEELYAMSTCSHHIMANSTFSWWAVYLGDFSNKVVVAPKVWFGPYGPQEYEELYHSLWIRV
jgi:hypothetical protein